MRGERRGPLNAGRGGTGKKERVKEGGKETGSGEGRGEKGRERGGRCSPKQKFTTTPLLK